MKLNIILSININKATIMLIKVLSQPITLEIINIRTTISRGKKNTLKIFFQYSFY